MMIVRRSPKNKPFRQRRKNQNDRAKRASTGVATEGRNKPAVRKTSRRIGRQKSRDKQRRAERRTARERSRRRRCGIDERLVHKVAKSAFGELLHHKQVLSVALVVLGVVFSARMTIHAIGAALAGARGGCMKHGIKQVDRFMSNAKIKPLDLRRGLVAASVGKRKRIEVSMDWTDFDKDDHTTLALSLIVRRGRAIPIVWSTVRKSQLKKKQTLHERTAVQMLRDALPDDVRVTVIADRGFGSTDLYDHLLGIPGFDFIIRFRQKIFVTATGRYEKASALVPRNGSVRVLRDARLTAKRAGPYTVVLHKARKMKDAWCLATSLDTADGRDIVRAYGHRFECEEGFRDLKDWRYGLALRHTSIKDAGRRERILFAFALAAFLLTIVGVESERLGCDRYLRANTSSRRTHSLFRQGREILGGALPDDLLHAVLVAARRTIVAALTNGFCYAIA